MAEKCKNESVTEPDSLIPELATMFRKMVPSDRLLPPAERNIPDLPQDHFTFDMEDLRDRSDMDSSFGYGLKDDHIVLKDDLKIEKCFESHKKCVMKNKFLEVS